MLRTNIRNSSHNNTGLVLLILCSGVAGCRRSTEQVAWILGTHLFLIWAASLAIVLLLQRLHRWPVFISLVEKISRPASAVGACVAAVGGWFIVSGIPELFTYPGTEALKTFLGVMVLIAGVYMSRWARASSATDKAGHAKVVTMTAGFVVGLTYVLYGAGILKTNL